MNDSISTPPRKVYPDTPITAQQVAEMVTALLSAGTVMLALDFDQTIVRVHTGGYWKKTSKKLSAHVRPFFLLLLPEAHKQGLKVAVTTFSSQPDMLIEALSHVLPKEVVAGLVIRAEDRAKEVDGLEGNSWALPDGVEDDGKNCHMASAALELGLINQSQGLCAQMGKGRVVLVDDDENNCDSAQDVGVDAVECLFQLPGNGTEIELLNNLNAIANRPPQ